MINYLLVAIYSQLLQNLTLYFFKVVPVYLCVSVCVALARRSERIFGRTHSLGKRKVARVPGRHSDLSGKKTIIGAGSGIFKKLKQSFR